MGTNLKLFNTASRSCQEFVPDGDEVHMYCCGPTVYNYAHIGNLRTYLFEDVLKRALLSRGLRLRHIVNITDVGHLTSDADEGEDKMEKGAVRDGKSVWQIARSYTDAFMKNIQDLNILEPDVWPRATDHIPEMIDMVRQLVDKGFTYTTVDGIYFDTSKFPRYCEFASLDAESLRAGLRVDMGEKRNPTDFALWKFSPAGVRRQMEWNSPWGTGFPGWHIECSAMALKYLHQPIDIHCGGIDHVRVHHTNEIAQTEAATGKPFVKFWLHGEFLTLDAEKMAKSGQGFITLETLKQRGIDPLAYRLFCFSAHYRSPLAFSWEGIEGAAQALVNLRRIMAGLGAEDGAVDEQAVAELVAPFWAAVYDDLNMPRALAVLWEIVRSKTCDASIKRAAVARIESITALDLFKVSTRQEIRDASNTIVLVAAPGELPVQPEDIFEKVLARRSARASREWARADAVRDELAAMNIVVKDLPGGVTECRLNQ